ncbi:MAG: hypothetical protein WEE89_11515 [Gemmatimonadota bacterium]
MRLTQSLPIIQPGLETIPNMVDRSRRVDQSLLDPFELIGCQVFAQMTAVPVHLCDDEANKPELRRRIVDRGIACNERVIANHQDNRVVGMCLMRDKHNRQNFGGFADWVRQDNPEMVGYVGIFEQKKARPCSDQVHLPDEASRRDLGSEVCDGFFDVFNTPPDYPQNITVSDTLSLAGRRVAVLGQAMREVSQLTGRFGAVFSNNLVEDIFLDARQIFRVRRLDQRNLVTSARGDERTPDWRLVLHRIDTVHRRTHDGPVCHRVERVEGDGSPEALQRSPVGQVHELDELENAEGSARKLEQATSYLCGLVFSKNRSHYLKNTPIVNPESTKSVHGLVLGSCRASGLRRFAVRWDFTDCFVPRSWDLERFGTWTRGLSFLFRSHWFHPVDLIEVIGNY